MNQNIKTEKRSWAIVDGYSSGKLYAKLLNSQGITVYHIQSMKEILEYDSKSFDSTQYRHNFVNAGDYNQLLNELKTIRGLDVVLAGCETGVELADLISEDLGLPTNGRSKTEARRDKYVMATTLASAGIRAAKTHLVKTLPEIDSTLSELGLPIVVKPCASAGSDDVYICKTKEEVVNAFNCIYLKTNTLGLLNTEVLLQQLLLGKQYIVNSVSYNGEHFAVEIWEDNREDVGSAYIYNYERLLLSYGKLEQDLVAYTKTVLSALGVRNGPCHVELMVNDGIPTLIEVGARPAGGIQQEVLDDAQGYSHVSATIDCFINRGLTIAFQNKVDSKHVISASLISRRSGILKGYRRLDSINELSSFKCLVGLPAVGDFVPCTRDLESSPGILMLSHSSLSQVLDDLDVFRAIEREYLFDFQL